MSSRLYRLIGDDRQGEAFRKFFVLVFGDYGFGHGIEIYRQSVEFTDNEGRPYYTWTLGRPTWANYNQQEAWRENPNMRLNVYVMPVGVIWHQDSSCGPSLMADIGTRFTRHIYSGLRRGDISESRTLKVPTASIQA